MVCGDSWARRGWCTGLVLLMTLLACCLLVPLSAWAEESYEISPIGTDPARRVDRYQITLGPGASLWELGFNRLPLIAIEQGDSKVVEIVEQSFRAQSPDRGPELVRPGDNFVLEVPAGSFVSKTVDKQ